MLGCLATSDTVFTQFTVFMLTLKKGFSFISTSNVITWNLLPFFGHFLSTRASILQLTNSLQNRRLSRLEDSCLSMNRTFHME